VNNTGTPGLFTAWILVNPVESNAGMVPRENLEESVVRTGRDFPAGGNPCLSEGLTHVHARKKVFFKRLVKRIRLD